MQKNLRNHRVVWLDMLRILCCFFVIVNHTYDHISLPRISPSLRTLSFFSMMFSNIAVPVFLMISGCTLLTKSDSIQKSLERFLRIAAALLLFSSIYEIHAVMSGQIAQWSVKHFLNAIYTWNITVSYWYLYTYAGILLMLPFLQKLAQAMAPQDFHLYFAVSVFFHGIWPIIVEYTPVSAYCAHFSLPLFTEHIFYLFLGYYLFVHSHRQLPILACIAGLLISPMLCALVIESAYAASEPYLYLDNTALFPVIVSSFCAFSLASRLRFSERISRIVNLLGSCAFGAYLLSDLFIMLLAPALTALRAVIHPFAAVTLYQLLVLSASLSTGWILKNLPLFRKLL